MNSVAWPGVAGLWCARDNVSQFVYDVMVMIRTAWQNRNRVSVAMIGAITVAMVMSLLVAGCSQSFDPADHAGVVKPISGKIRIIEVQPWMNSATAQFEGHRCTAWWDDYSAFYIAGHLLHQLPDVPGGRYHFDGLLTDRDLYLGQVWQGTSAPRFNGGAGHVVQYGLRKQHLADQTIMTATPVSGGLKLPTTTPAFRVPRKQQKIPLPTELGN